MPRPDSADDALAAAARIVSREGPTALTVTRVARETGLSRATLYRRGKSREAMLDALETGGADVGDRSDARTRILTAAKEEFGRVGFDAATVEQIAAVAGVGAATLYRHFGDKEGLIAAFLDELTPRRVLREVAARSSGDLERDLTELAETMLTGMRDDAPLVRLMLLEALTGGPALARVRKATPQRSISTVASLFRKYVASGYLRREDPEMLARAFIGMLFSFGVLDPVLHATPMGNPAELARSITKLFLRGARNRRSKR